MAFELDHVFVFASPGGAEAERLVSFGLTEGSGNVHRGQGTANRRFFFRRGMLELIWVCDETEASSPTTRPTALSDRARYRSTGASPFGICLRARDAIGGEPPPPFDTWTYRPDYLRSGREIAVARTAPHEPLLFMARTSAVPPQALQVTSTSRHEPIEHPNGLSDMTSIRVTVAGDAPPSPALRVIDQLGVATVLFGREPRMEITFDGGVRGKQLDLQPALPLILRW